MLDFAYISNNRAETSKGFVKQFVEPLEQAHNLKSIYKEKDIAYPKYHKMDGLCKISLLVFELFLELGTIKKEDLGSMPIVMANSFSSASSDVKHHVNILEDKTSPSVFVYTLPNIAIGEVAIKHKMRGENIFYVLESFNAEKLIQFSKPFLSKEKKNVLVAWSEFTPDIMESFMFCLNDKTTVTEVEKLYNKINGRVSK